MVPDLQTICKTIERQQCRTHHQYPSVKVSGSSINISACCDTFRKELEKLLDKSVDDALGSISSETI